MLTLRFSFPLTVTQTALATTLALAGVLSGNIPTLSPNFSESLRFENVAFAQNFSDAEVRSYAQIVLQMEPRRQTVLRDIATIIDSKPNTIPCYQPRTLRRLPQDARELAVSYCNAYKELIESQGLTVTRFNEITQQAQTNTDLKSRIQGAMLAIQS
jgi:hypothetical protein